MVLKEFMEGWRKGTKFYIHDVTGYVKFCYVPMVNRGLPMQVKS